MTDLTRVVVPFVEIDATNAESLKAWLDAYCDAPEVRLDMRQVEFMDSSGINAFVRHLSERPSPDSVRLVNVTQPVERVLDITGLDRIIHREPTCSRAGTRTRTPSAKS